MSYFVDMENKAFYDTNFHTYIPEGARQIDTDVYESILNGQNNGLRIDYSEFPPRCVERDQVFPSIQDLKIQIDQAVAEIYAKWTRFQLESLARENAAKEFKAAGYQGDAGAWIKSYAQHAGLTDAEAADRVLTQADAQKSAQVRLAELRMSKEELNSLEGEESYSRFKAILEEITTIGASVEFD